MSIDTGWGITATPRYSIEQKEKLVSFKKSFHYINRFIWRFKVVNELGDKKSFLLFHKAMKYSVRMDKVDINTSIVGVDVLGNKHELSRSLNFATDFYYTWDAGQWDSSTSTSSVYKVANSQTNE